jgi:hypothetical protein
MDAHVKVDVAPKDVNASRVVLLVVLDAHVTSIFIAQTKKN